MKKVYIIEERVSDYSYGYGPTNTYFYVFATLEKAQNWVNEKITEITEIGREVASVDKTFECGVTDIDCDGTQYQYIIREREVK